MSVNRVFDQEAAVKLANEEGMFLSIVDGQRLANLLNRAFEQGKELSSEFDVRTIILEVAPGNGDGVEVYAKSVEDVEKKLASLDDELEQWQVGIRRLPPPKAAQTKPVAFKLLRKNLQGEWVSDNDHWTDGAPSEELKRDTADSEDWKIVYAFDNSDRIVELTEELQKTKQSLQFYRQRVNAINEWQSKMRDPERTVVCDIIANGNTLAPEVAGNRYDQKPN